MAFLTISGRVKRWSEIKTDPKNGQAYSFVTVQESAKDAQGNWTNIIYSLAVRGNSEYVANQQRLFPKDKAVLLNGVMTPGKNSVKFFTFDDGTQRPEISLNQGSLYFPARDANGEQAAYTPAPENGGDEYDA